MPDSFGPASTSPHTVLLQAALTARDHAHAPYSKFFVGAALEDENGRIHTGCNVENASYGLTICAERVAIAKAVSEGVRKFRRLAVAAGTDPLTPPCGACRQVLAEFCEDLEIFLVNPSGKTDSVTLKELLPRAFHGSLL
jgi:cytidine deaminase